jgi:hypothetical protein
MTHLSDSELTDYIESNLGPGRRAHADACHACVAKADRLRSVLAEVSSDDVPVPSPLYWEHFAGRIADAIRNEIPDRTPLLPLSWRGLPIVRWAAAGAMAVVVLTTVVWRATLHAPARHAGAPAAAARAAAVVSDAPGDDIEADEAWAVVRTAAEGLRWDDARAAGLSAHPGASEGIALELSAPEREELARIINGELKRPGA